MATAKQTKKAPLPLMKKKYSVKLNLRKKKEDYINSTRREYG